MPDHGRYGRLCTACRPSTLQTTAAPLTTEVNQMNTLFERTGPLTELSSYPQWAQDMVADCAATKQRVLDHDIWRMMTALQLDHESTRNFMMGLWPFIERFPSFMALNLDALLGGSAIGHHILRPLRIAAQFGQRAGALKRGMHNVVPQSSMGAAADCSVDGRLGRQKARYWPPSGIAVMPEFCGA